MKTSEVFYESVRKIVERVLIEKGLVKGDIHFGEVDEVLNRNTLKVFLNGSDQSQKIPCNPDIQFEEGDEVIVQFFNKNTKNKFVISRKNVSL